MKAKIEHVTAALKGKVLWNCLRAADMATFDFGQRRTVRDTNGKSKDVGEFALHVQCAWRITQLDRIIIGGRDLFFPADYQQGDDIPDEFDWDIHPNRRDKLMRSFFENGTREFMVQSVEVGQAGRLEIRLSDGFVLEIFPDDSLTGEHWRLFQPYADQPHLVVTGAGIET